MTACAQVFAAGLLLVGTVAEPAPQNQAGKSDAPASFEVASVKPNNSGEQSSGTEWQRSGALNATNLTLRSLIARAYEVREFQVNGPDWLAASRFDIAARAPEGTPDSSRPVMLRTLLAERFKLAAHFETREQQPVYALVLLRTDGRLGPQLKKSPLVCSGSAPSGGFCGVNTSVGNTGGRIIGGGLTMDRVAAALANFAVDQTVIDRTGLDGAFDFELLFSRLPSNARPDAPSIFTAVQEQLGLKLEPARGPVQFLVIDSIQRPTPD